jgi:hypothetical protein
MELIPELEEVRRDAEALHSVESERSVGSLVEDEATEKECCIYLKSEEMGKLLELVSCGGRVRKPTSPIMGVSRVSEQKV